MLVLVVVAIGSTAVAQTKPESRKNLLANATLTESLERAKELARQTTIFRDTYGVPHVVGPTAASVVFGFTYARAEDEFQ